MFRELTRRERTKLNSFFSYWNVFDYFKDKKFLINGKQVYMIEDNEHIEHIIKNNPIVYGIRICELRKHVHIALPALQLFVNNNCSRRVKINKHAEILFLYGKDIFASSILEHTHDFKANDEVIIVNTHNEALGIGKARYDHDKMKDGVVITNLKDLGIYLRDERSIYEELIKI